MEKANGATAVKVEEMTTLTALEAIFEALSQMQESIDELSSSLAETNEKLANLSLDNDGFNSLDED